jgi:hypothetical protein
MMPRRAKPTKGQVSLLNEVYQYELVLQPHKVIAITGEAVVVLRVPEGCSELDVRTSQKAAKELAGGIKTAPNKFYRFKKPRHEM